MLGTILSQPAPLVAACSAFLGAAGAVWTLVRIAGRGRDGRPNPAPFLHIGRRFAPLAERVAPPPVIRCVRAHLLGDPNCEKAGAEAVLGFAVLAGIGLTAAASLALGWRGHRGSLLLTPLLIPATITFLAVTLRGLDLERLWLIRKDFPYLLDLVVLMCRGGATPMTAFSRAAAELRDTTLGVELRITAQLVERGLGRSEALAALVGRAPLPEVEGFAAAFGRADEQGISVADSIEQFANRLRQTRLQQAEATAGKAGIKIMVPGALLLLVSFIVLLAPFIIKFLHQGLPL